MTLGTGASGVPHERFRLSGNAIVTGGAGDLGFAASRALLEYGVEGPMVFDANPTEAEVEASIRFLKVGIRDEAAVDTAVAETVLLLGPVTTLLNFTGLVCSSQRSGEFPPPEVTYNVSEAGVKAMVRSLAREWARYGIRVNSISPGYMDTGDLAWYPLGRMGRPDELCGVVVMLASRAGSYFNGPDLLMDGGQPLFM
ncbi:oxidoreductase-like protein [Nemania serpens]|nr:oxidoreductase-like protein [Nemania serpens]